MVPDGDTGPGGTHGVTATSQPGRAAEIQVVAELTNLDDVFSVPTM
ncbi:hypothetical protein GCM10027088_39620 [Nocardia goodfellowii]